MSETSVEPQSIAADMEPVVEPERKVRVFDVLRLTTPAIVNEKECPRWIDIGTIEDVYLPLPQEIGEAFGEGEFMLIERDDRYSFRSVYSMRVVAEKRYREATDEDA